MVPCYFLYIFRRNGITLGVKNSIYLPQMFRQLDSVFQICLLTVTMSIESLLVEKYGAFDLTLRFSNEIIEIIFLPLVKSTKIV